jgi:hypothetical protein
MDGGGGQTGKLVTEEDMLIRGRGPLSQIAAQGFLGLRREVDGALARAFAPGDQAWLRFFQVEVGEQQSGNLPNSETAPSILNVVKGMSSRYIEAGPDDDHLW